MKLTAPIWRIKSSGALPYWHAYNLIPNEESGATEEEAEEWYVKSEIFQAAGGVISEMDRLASTKTLLEIFEILTLRRSVSYKSNATQDDA